MYRVRDLRYSGAATGETSTSQVRVTNFVVFEMGQKIPGQIAYAKSYMTEIVTLSDELPPLESFHLIVTLSDELPTLESFHLHVSSVPLCSCKN